MPDSGQEHTTASNDGFLVTTTNQDVIVNPVFQGQGIGTTIIQNLLDYVEKNTPPGGRSSIPLIAEKEKEALYETLGFKKIPHEFFSSGMRKIIHKKEIS